MLKPHAPQMDMGMSAQYRLDCDSHANPSMACSQLPAFSRPAADRITPSPTSAMLIGPPWGL